MNAKTQLSVCSPSNEAEDIKGQVEYGKGSKGDKEEHDSKTPPSPDGQTGLKNTNTDTQKDFNWFENHWRHFEEKYNVQDNVLTNQDFLYNNVLAYSSALRVTDKTCVPT